MASSDAAHDDTESDSIPIGRHEWNECAQCHKPDTERNPLQDHVDNSHHPPVVLALLARIVQYNMLHNNLGNRTRQPSCSEWTRAVRHMKCYRALRPMK